jgi:exodeoxyribonuclease VII small subunit
VATSNTKQAQNEQAPAEQAGAEPAEAEQSEALSYEQARDELASTVKRLETGGLTLEQSLELWERGERLAAVCGRLLEGARARLSAATADRSGDEGDEDDRPF